MKNHNDFPGHEHKHFFLGHTSWGFGQGAKVYVERVYVLFLSLFEITEGQQNCNWQWFESLQFQMAGGLDLKYPLATGLSGIKKGVIGCIKMSVRIRGEFSPGCIKMSVRIRGEFSPKPSPSGPCTIEPAASLRNDIFNTERKFQLRMTFSFQDPLWPQKNKARASNLQART